MRASARPPLRGRRPGRRTSPPTGASFSLTQHIHRPDRRCRVPTEVGAGSPRDRRAPPGPRSAPGSEAPPERGAARMRRPRMPEEDRGRRPSGARVARGALPDAQPPAAPAGARGPPIAAGGPQAGRAPLPQELRSRAGRPPPPPPRRVRDVVRNGRANRNGPGRTARQPHRPSKRFNDLPSSPRHFWGGICGECRATADFGSMCSTDRPDARTSGRRPAETHD